MDIIKYFYEEPAALEILTPDDDPDARRRNESSSGPGAFPPASPYHRGYLAGTDLARGRIGLTAVARAEAFVRPLLEWLGEGAWQQAAADGSVAALDEAGAEAVLRDPSGVAALVHAPAPVDPEALRETVGRARRYALPALRRVLDRGAVVLFPEPAHHGFDWSLFARRPMQAALSEAITRHPVEGTRRFVLPFRKARSEQKFYFEQWQLDGFSRDGGDLPDYIREL